MITRWRQEFNQQYRDSDYLRLLSLLEQQSGTPIQFRVAETPCFLPRPLLDELASIGATLTQQLLDNPAYLAASLDAIPPRYRLPSDSARPHFMTADFGFVRDGNGGLSPKLVELQAFPSVFALQVLFGEAYRSCYRLSPDLEYFLGGHTAESFSGLFRRVVLGGHAPEEVVLSEIHPEQQKTLPDFLVTSKHLGIATVDATRLVARREDGRTRLYYSTAGGLKPIRRIYNRVIVDELIQKQISLPFDYRDDLAVEWAGHPNWYFRISKFSIPFLKHASVPEAVFLDDWLAGAGSQRLHGNRQDVLLKPLFSFAGKGIVFGPTDEELAALPAAAGREYLVQERVDFTPVIDTPFGPTQAEIRIMYLWPDGDDAKMEPVLSLARLGRGKMMGVDHNRNQKWVGASTTYFPKQE